MAAGDLRIAVDAMGSDGGPSVAVAAALAVLAENPLLHIDLVGEEAALRPLLAAGQPDRLRLLPAGESVSMSDAPLQALRGKSRSSMRLALEQVARGEARACLSAGNTGALVLMGHHVLKTLPGIERAAMCTTVPTPQGQSRVLDIGAGLVVEPFHLLQYAFMGTALSSILDGIERPTVGLLNVGEEALKGTQIVRDADRLLRAQSNLAYQGFVEGDDLFSGAADVIVCDGFAGNIALKASEGVARLVAHKLSARLGSRPWLRWFTLLMASELRALRSELDPEHFNGACLLGLRGVVVKSHGAATVDGFAQALRLTVKLAGSGLVQALEQRLPQALAISEQQ